MSTVEECRHYFSAALPCELLCKRTEKFLCKLNAKLPTVSYRRTLMRVRYLFYLFSHYLVLFLLLCYCTISGEIKIATVGNGGHRRSQGTVFEGYSCSTLSYTFIAQQRQLSIIFSIGKRLLYVLLRNINLLVKEKFGFGFEIILNMRNKLYIHTLQQNQQFTGINSGLQFETLNK